MKVKCGNCGHEWETSWWNIRPIVCENCGAVWLYGDLPFVLPKEFICEIARDPKSQGVFVKHKIMWDGEKFVESEYQGNKKVPKISDGKITVFEWSKEKQKWLKRQIAKPVGYKVEE